MSDLKIFDLYESTDVNTVNNFNKKKGSSLNVKLDYSKIESDYEWLDIMEDTVKYIDNILRNPNRFIVNEEDVIKIELAKRVTVESIKHLSKNTNLIQDVDKKTGDVRPSKILNINKEESYDTYENRFIYSLIQNMKMFIEQKKKNMGNLRNVKNNKSVIYYGTTIVGKEKVNFSMTLDTELKMEGNFDLQEIFERIEKLEHEISSLTFHGAYKVIEKKRISLVTSPIKKTNLIMKNVNFQYATKLWDYLQSHMDNDMKDDKKEKIIKNDPKVLELMDESFLISYLAINAIDKKEPSEEEVSETRKNRMIRRLIDLSKELTEEQLKELIADQFPKLKLKTIASEKEIQNKFKEGIDKYLDKIKNLRI